MDAVQNQAVNLSICDVQPAPRPPRLPIPPERSQDVEMAPASSLEPGLSRESTGPEADISVHLQGQQQTPGPVHGPPTAWTSQLPLRHLRARKV